jgi:hypothetical protein
MASAVAPDQKNRLREWDFPALVFSRYDNQLDFHTALETGVRTFVAAASSRAPRGC